MLSLLTRSVNLEDPRIPLAQDTDGYGLMSNQTKAGINVTRDMVLSHPAVWKCVNLLSKSVARLPLEVYKRQGETGRKTAKDHPSYRLLRRQPNDLTSAYTFIQSMTAEAVLGNSYAYIYRDGAGDAIELVKLRSDKTSMVIDQTNRTIGYGTIVNDEVRKLQPENVLHLRGFSIDGNRGLDVVETLREAFALGIGQRIYRAIYFRNNGKPNVALEAPPELSEAARMRLIESYRKATGGLEQAHKAVLLEEGVKLHEFGANPEQTQVIEAEEHELVQIANMFGVPPSKVGAKTNVSYKSLEQDNQNYLDEGVDPLLHMWEGECWLKLLSERQKKADSHFIKFNRRRFVQADLASRYAAYNVAIMAGFMNRDEVRAEEDMNPIPEEKGEAYFIPLNMATTDDPPETGEGDEGDEPAPGDIPGTEDDEVIAEQIKTDPGNKSRAQEALAALFVRDCHRMFVRLLHAAERQAEKGANFVAWLDTIENDHGATISKALYPSVEGIGGRQRADEAGQKLIDVARARLLDISGECTASNLADSLRMIRENIEAETEWTRAASVAIHGADDWRQWEVTQ